MNNHRKEQAIVPFSLALWLIQIFDIPVMLTITIFFNSPKKKEKMYFLKVDIVGITRQSFETLYKS